ncbi:MAG: CDC48 family AAA ATPase [Deltaproteobacteria bacterium]|nr:CDC48 family AAA ATPase [Deltaproteobacteria bacterium]
MARGSFRIKVAGAQQQDVGKGILRIGLKQIRSLGLERGDVIEIKGKRVTAAIAVPAYSEDEGIDVVRMDGFIRGNAKVGIGEYVELKKTDWKEAKKVSLAPAKEGLRITGSGEGLKPTLLYRPLVQGDLISTTAFNRPRQSFPTDLYSDDFFRGFFESPAYGLMEIRLVVTSTIPKGIVRVSEETQMELMPEYREAKEREILEVTYDDLGGIKPVVEKVREIIELPLKHPELFDRLGIDPPKGVLLHGPPGTGKTLLAKAVAHESEAYFTVINGPEIMGKFYGESEERLRQVFTEAEKNAPAIIFIDELDSIAPKRGEVTGETERRIVAQLLTLMDGLKARRNVIVIGATNRVEAIDPALRRPGRFDREIEIRIPDEPGRREILQIHTRGMPLGKDVEMKKISEVTHGYTGSDIAALAKEAALAALRRVMPILNLEEKTVPAEILEKLTVNRDDFEQGLKEVQPSALREIIVEIPNVRWEEVGGLKEVKQLLHEMVELPLKRPESFSRIGIRSPKGVLLYGPPGTGKTMIAKAVATEAGANFLTAKGSALLSKWYGESEKKIAEFFHRARQVTPAILFFDELDSLAPVRGGSLGEPQVTERVVNQLLGEMDGMEELKGVVVLGATNRPDMIDPALLRPGRFDEIVYVPVPDPNARLEIFRSHTKRMALDRDVNLEKLAEITDRLTGADIAGVCMKAGLYALRENPEARMVNMEHFFRAVKEAIPSVTEEMEREYEKMARKVKQESVRIGFRRGE